MSKHKTTVGIVALCFLLQLLQNFYPQMIMHQILNLEYLSSVKTLHLFLAGLIIHMFSHAGWAHLLGNMTVWIPAFIYVENKLGSKEFLGFYLLCGIASALTHSAMPFNGGGMIGASGAIFGCVAGSCVLFGETLALRMLSAVLISLLLVPQLMALNMGPDGGPVAYAGHVGGAIAGIAYIAMRKREHLKPCPEKKCKASK